MPFFVSTTASAVRAKISKPPTSCPASPEAPLPVATGLPFSLTINSNVPVPAVYGSFVAPVACCTARNAGRAPSGSKPSTFPTPNRSCDPATTSNCRPPTFTVVSVVFVT